MLYRLTVVLVTASYNIMSEHIPSAHACSQCRSFLYVQLAYGVSSLLLIRRFSPVVLSCLFRYVWYSYQCSTFLVLDHLLVLLSQPTKALPLCCCYLKQAHSLVLLTVCSYSVFYSIKVLLLTAVTVTVTTFPFLLFTFVLERYF